MMFEEGSVRVLSYPLETVLAESSRLSFPGESPTRVAATTTTSTL